MLLSPFSFNNLAFFEYPFLKKRKALWSPGRADVDDKQMAKGLFKETFTGRLESLRNEQVNIEYEASERLKKKALGAVLSRVGADFVELSPANPQLPFTVLSYHPGLPLPAVEFARGVIIRDINRIISVEKA